MTNKSLRTISAGAAAVVVLAAAGLWLLRGGSGKYSGPTGDASILLITLDTLRADHIGAYGYSGVRTPVIDGLADDGVLFEHATSPAVMTLPSHASILTGTYPTTHGIRDNGDYKLNPNALTLAEVLRSRGFRTGAVIGSFVLDSMFGLDQGFEHYDDALPVRGPNEAFFAERPAGAVTEAALRYLEEARGSRFFLWVHYFDPHHPYTAPPPFREQYARQPYDAEIAYVDAELGRLLGELRRMGLRENTIVAVVGDHGEGLGDHGEQSHGVFVYEEATRVPMIISMPPHVPSGVRIGGVVRTVDLMPTLLDLARIDPGQAAQPVQGESLWPMIADESAGRESRPAYAEAMVPLLLYGWSPLASVRDGRYKYIEAPRPELYDLTLDPGETRNLAESSPELAAGYRERLVQLRAEITRSGAAAEQLEPDPEREARLRSLGYVSGGGPPASTGPGALPDPKDMKEMLGRINRVYIAFGSGQHPRAVSEAESILATNPDNASVRFYMASSLSAMGRFSEAIDQYGILIEKNPSDIQSMAGIGWALLNLEKFDEASAMFGRILEIYPQHVQAQASLADVAFVKGDYAEAARLYKAVLTQEPDHLSSILTLARMYEGTGRFEEAAILYTRATEIDPANLQHWMNLAWARFQDNRNDEAIEALDHALRLNPKAPELLVARGDVLAASGRLDEARQSYEDSLVLMPDLPSALYGLGLVELQVANHDEAVRRLEQAISLRPDNPLWREKLGEALAGAGRYREAAAVLEKLLASPRLPMEKRGQLEEQAARYRRMGG